MLIREYQKNDRKAVEEISILYWTDPEFLKELSNELESYLKGSEDIGFFVSEENGEILGIVGFRKLNDSTEYLRPFALTSNPVEFYVIAVKHRGKGTGEILKSKLIEEARKLGFTEILLYSPNSHSESWNFHDKLGFEKVGEVIPPEDNTGYVWRKVL